MRQYRDWVAREKELGSNFLFYEYFQNFIEETERGNALARVWNVLYLFVFRSTTQIFLDRLLISFDLSSLYCWLLAER